MAASILARTGSVDAWGSGATSWRAIRSKADASPLSFRGESVSMSSTGRAPSVGFLKQTQGPRVWSIRDASNNVPGVLLSQSTIAFWREAGRGPGFSASGHQTLERQSLSTRTAARR